MRRMLMVCAMVSSGLIGVAFGQVAAAPAGPTGPTAEVQRSYAALKVNILKAADNMPPDGYSFALRPRCGPLRGWSTTSAKRS